MHAIARAIVVGSRRNPPQIWIERRSSRSQYSSQFSRSDMDFFDEDHAITRAWPLGT
jgi:hypothetical protein